MQQGKDPETHMRITVLAQGTLTDGRHYWAYVEMSPSKAIAFKKAMEDVHNPPQPQAYGEVVSWGEGAEVPTETRTQMEKERGVNHDLEALFKQYKPE